MREKKDFIFFLDWKEDQEIFWWNKPDVGKKYLLGFFWSMHILSSQRYPVGTIIWSILMMMGKKAWTFFMLDFSNDVPGKVFPSFPSPFHPTICNATSVSWQVLFGALICFYGQFKLELWKLFLIMDEVTSNLSFLTKLISWLRKLFIMSKVILYF